MKYEIKISNIEASSSEQAKRIAQDLQDIKNLLSNEELHDLAELLKTKPGIVQKAKQFKNLF